MGARRAHPHWAFQLVDTSGRTAAFFALAESFAFFAHGSYGILNELWVNPEVRSRGVGKDVIDSSMGPFYPIRRS